MAASAHSMCGMPCAVPGKAAIRSSARAASVQAVEPAGASRSICTSPCTGQAPQVSCRQAKSVSSAGWVHARLVVDGKEYCSQALTAC